jgi:spore germination cell wall hydrolase CwlJ-like protein
VSAARILAASLLVVAGTAQTEPPGMAFEANGRACIALAVFAEARGESWLGQALVVQTIRNRMSHDGWPSDPCEVVLQLQQFHGLRDWPLPRRPWDIDDAAWRQALQVTDAVMLGDYQIAPPACERVTHFYAGAEPAWAADMDASCRVGGHTFLSASAD